MSDDRGPIFIGGLAHTGKTQVRMVLGAHPDFCMTRRTYMWNRFHGRFDDLGRAANLERCLAVMLADEGVRSLHPDPERIRREFREGPPSYARLFALFHQHHAERAGRRRWGDQLGFVERFADPIFAAVPSARMIHMVRDPRTRYARATARELPGKAGWDTAMWLHSARLADRNRRQYRERYLVVRYETLRARPLDTTAEICGFLDEECVPPMEEALRTIRFDDIEPQMPSGNGDGRGRRRSRAEAAFVAKHARRELLAFGYPVTSESVSPVTRLSFALAEWPLDRAGMTAWRLTRGGSGRLGVG
jgi:hypothetical protein